MREGATLVGRRERGCQLTGREKASRALHRAVRAFWTPRTAASAGLGFAVAMLAGLASAETYLYRMGRDYPVIASRPETSARVCSFREPVCVHASSGAPSQLLLDTLADLEHARTALVRVLGLPSPLPDGSLGGSPAFDLYLTDPSRRSGGAIRPVVVERDEPAIGEPDRASAFALLDANLEGCERGNLVTRAVASAIGLGIDAAEDDTLRESRAAYLAELVTPCGAVTRSLVDDFQRHPERAIFSSANDVEPARGLLFPWYLDLTLGTRTPGILPFALTAASRQHTPLGSFIWVDEPDIFDSLRASLASREPPQKLSGLLLDFAVARAFVGNRDDGMHMPETRWTGESGRVRFDWSVPFTSLPRSLAPRLPIEPTGASYLWVDLEGAPREARVTFRAEWEPPVLFRWAIVRVRKDGTEASRVTVTGQDGATSATQVIEAIDDLAGLLIVGTNGGDIGLTRPFDPDEQPHEPHGYVVTLWGE